MQILYYLLYGMGISSWAVGETDHHSTERSEISRHDSLSSSPTMPPFFSLSLAKEKKLGTERLLLGLGFFLIWMSFIHVSNGGSPAMLIVNLVL